MATKVLASAFLTMVMTVSSGAVNPSRAEGGPDRDHARRRAGSPADPRRAAHRSADPGDRPLGGPHLQPGRPGAPHPQERPWRRPQPQLPLPLGQPRRPVRVRTQARFGARDAGDDAVPEQRAAKSDPQLPPASARRRHRHQAAPVRCSHRPQAEPAGQDVRLRLGLPRDDDHVVQPPVPRRRRHRRVRPSPAAAAVADAGAPPGPVDLGCPPRVASQRPSNVGFSFATKAATAASWSRVAPVSCIIRLSNSSASSNEWPEA